MKRARAIMKPSATLCLLLVCSIMLLGTVCPALTLAASPIEQANGLIGESINNNGVWTSPNWAGYVVNGSIGSVTYVGGSWIVPAVSNATSSSPSYSSFWVGIDGFSLIKPFSNTVEQTGTDSDIIGGNPVYYAWYEFWPAGTVEINPTTYPVHAGDMISASVTVMFTLKLFRGRSFVFDRFLISINDTSGKSDWTFSARGTSKAADRSSAEWIAEDPMGSNGLLPLADFGTVYFSSCYAIVSGKTGSISGFGSAVQTVTMNQDFAEGVPYYTASPSALLVDGTSFSVTESFQ